MNIRRVAVLPLLLVTCGLLIGAGSKATKSSSDRGDYPAEWWQEIPRDSAASWEILPQDAEEGEVILSKRTALGILSNFADTAFRFRRKRYASLEGFWQAMKYPENSRDPRARHTDEWPHERSEVEQMTGFDAKDAGKFGSNVMRAMDINWVTFKGARMDYRTSEKGEHYDLIREAMVAKLEQNPEVEEILLKTGDLVLRPDHRQGDNPPPAWQYHQIWMEIRSDLQEKKSPQSH